MICHNYSSSSSSSSSSVNPLSLGADFFTKRLHSRRRCARTPSVRFSLAVHSYGRSWGSSSLETRPSPSSTRACSVSYNYAWEYFWREGQTGCNLALHIIYLTSQHRTMTLYDSRGTHHVIKCPSIHPRVIITREHAQGTRSLALPRLTLRTTPFTCLPRFDFDFDMKNEK